MASTPQVSSARKHIVYSPQHVTSQSNFDIQNEASPPISSQIKSAEIAVLQNNQMYHNFGVEPVLDPSDGTPLLDENSMPISVSKMLATKPLKRDLCTRPGPGNRQLTYMSGDSVTRTLNDVFGFDGWCLEIKNSNREVSIITFPEVYLHCCDSYES